MDREPPIPAELADADAPVWASELDEAIVVGEAPVPGAWQIETAGQAEWAMRKLAVLAARVDEIDALASGWRTRINEWENSEHARIAPGIDRFSTLLREYGIARREENPKEATIRLPSGQIKTTKPKTPRVEIDDEEVLLAWLTENVASEMYEQIVQCTPKVKLTELRAAVEVQYELRPWCQICGVALVESNVEGAGGVMMHDEPRSTAELQATDHVPSPGGGYVARLNGVELPGVSAELGDVTASVAVTR